MYTGTHKQRFDAEGKGKGKTGRTDAEGITLEKIVSRKLVGGMNKMSLSPSQSKTGLTRANSKESVVQRFQRTDSGTSVFDRLTDTHKYTGTHKQRFDDNGVGRGKAGRVDEGSIVDLSDIVTRR